MPLVIVWAEQDSPRLRYVLDWLLVECLGLKYRLTLDQHEAATADRHIFYGLSSRHVSIPASGLIYQVNTVTQQHLELQEQEGVYMLFPDLSGAYDIPFDLLSGIFFLLSRYEEYLHFTPDRHGRYPASSSVLAKCLEQPIVDEWVEMLRVFLEEEWKLSIPRRKFSFQPSYDIDIAWSYRFKGFRRSLGAMVKELVTMQLKNISERLKVMRGTAQDPYDSFVWIMTQHMHSEQKPFYFILAANAASAFDKNISPQHPRMRSLINGLAGNAHIGLHPSYYSDVKAGLLAQEKSTLEGIVGRPVNQSRQHYIKLRFPETYRRLIESGISDDWSMGYSTGFGFRAGTSRSFFWYDLQKEAVMVLRVHPFVFMDTTAHYDMSLSPSEAFLRLRQMADRLIACGGELVTIMHNFSLGTDAEWRGWRKEYERFLQDVHNKTGNAV